MVQKSQGRLHRLDGAILAVVKNGISTTSPSTGEFAGFLNSEIGILSLNQHVQKGKHHPSLIHCSILVGFFNCYDGCC